MFAENQTLCWHNAFLANANKWEIVFFRSLMCQARLKFHFQKKTELFQELPEFDLFFAFTGFRYGPWECLVPENSNELPGCSSPKMKPVHLDNGLENLKT